MRPTASATSVRKLLHNAEEAEKTVDGWWQKRLDSAFGTTVEITPIGRLKSVTVLGRSSSRPKARKDTLRCLTHPVEQAWVYVCKPRVLHHLTERFAAPFHQPDPSVLARLDRRSSHFSRCIVLKNGAAMPSCEIGEQEFVRHKTPGPRTLESC